MDVEAVAERTERRFSVEESDAESRMRITIARTGMCEKEEEVFTGRGEVGNTG